MCILAADSPGPAVFNAGTDRFGTMAEALTNLCAHAGTGADGQVAARPTGRGGDAGERGRCTSRRSPRTTG